jgi:hypothetical protein
MKKTVPHFVFLAAVSIMVAAGVGCGNGQLAVSGGATPFPYPSAACTTPPGETIQQVFPQNGSVDAPNLEGIVIAAAPNPLPTDWFFYATSIYGTTYPTSVGILTALSAQASPTPLPSPTDTPVATSFVVETGSNGIFATSTKFTIFLASSTCYPGIAENTFTTSATDSPPTPSPSPAAT